MARLEARTDTLHAETTSGQSFDPPYDGLELEIGGASGRMLFFRARQRTLTFFTDDWQLLDELRHASSLALQQQIEQ